MTNNIFFYDYLEAFTGNTGCGIVWASNETMAAMRIRQERKLPLCTAISICSADYVEKANNGHIIIENF